LPVKFTPEDCARLNLGYLDPTRINIAEWQNREDEGVLYVPRAGEILYRVSKVDFGRNKKRLDFSSRFY